MAETIFQKPLDAQVASNTDAITNLTTKETFSLSLPTGWSLTNASCFKMGKTVSISGVLKATTAITTKSVSFDNCIPAAYAAPYRVGFPGFDNASDTSLHGIAQGRIITFYRPETTSLTEIEFVLIYFLN